MKRKSYCRKSRRHLVGGAKVVGGGDNYDVNEIGKYIYDNPKAFINIRTLYYKYNNTGIPLKKVSSYENADRSRQIIYDPINQAHLKDITQIVITINPPNNKNNNRYSVKSISVQLPNKLTMGHNELDGNFFLRK